MLFKKRPVNSEGGGGRGKRTSNPAPSTPQPPPLHNGTDAPTFLKPDPLPSMTSQEYYEADEILKARHSVLVLIRRFQTIQIGFSLDGTCYANVTIEH